MRHLCIAIDGPAGAGKSTVAKEVSRKLGLLYVDTGAMYRALAWLALKYGVDVENEQAVKELMAQHQLKFERSHYGVLDIVIDGQSLYGKLRSPEVSGVVSQISTHALIRAELTKVQRHFGERYSVVMDGRDVGTVVLPNADVKIFLTASIEERARRRRDELTRKGHNVTMQELFQTIGERDRRDSSRETAPLKQADDSYLVDSTGKDVSQVVDEILQIVERVIHE